MHRLILGAGLCLVVSGPAGLRAAAAPAPATGPRPAPQAACPATGAAVLERVFSADCAVCWASDPGLRQAKARPVPRWVFDWIVPADAAAPLAAGALPESAERAERAARGTLAGLTAGPATERHQAPRALPAGLQLRARSGPAWQGYFGVQLSLRRTAGTRLPAGSTGWLALVEQVPGGSDGTPLDRALVRSLAGPLPLDALPAGQPLTHLRALRWPASAEPTRLQARAWIEAPDGTILAVAADQCR